MASLRRFVMSSKWTGILALSWFLLIGTFPLSAQQRLQVGQSSTRLSDGRTLVTGGFNANSRATGEAAVISLDGTATQLNSGMNLARAGHTATVLPDGTVLIFG